MAVDPADVAVGERVRAVLERLAVPYEIITIDPDFADTAQFCAKYGVPLDHSANTIIVASKKEPKQYCACLVLATTRLDVNHGVRKLMGAARVSFASGDETKALTGMLIGCVTVFALPDTLGIYVDERVMAPEWIIVASKKEPKQYCACLVLATTRLDVNHGVKKLMNASRVSFASADETKALTGMLIGGVTVFALPDTLPIYVDERVMAPEWIIVGGGGRSTKVKLAPDVLRRLPNVTVVPGLAGQMPAS